MGRPSDRGVPWRIRRALTPSRIEEAKVVAACARSAPGLGRNIRACVHVAVRMMVMLSVVVVSPYARLTTEVRKSSYDSKVREVRKQTADAAKYGND